MPELCTHFTRPLGEISWECLDYTDVVFNSGALRMFNIAYVGNLCFVKCGVLHCSLWPVQNINFLIIILFVQNLSIIGKTTNHNRKI